MNFLLWAVRLLVLFVIIRFVVGMVRQAMVNASRPTPRPSKRAAERLGGTLVRDPACGTYLPKDRAVAVTSGQAIEYFCSPKCRDEWAARG